MPNWFGNTKLIDTVAGCGTSEALYIKNAKRSSLPFISDTGSATADYRSKAYKI